MSESPDPSLLSTLQQARWPRPELMGQLGIELPILQAPMAGAGGVALAAAVAAAGGMGALPCAMLNSGQVLEQIGELREQTNGPVNLNFFCHQPAPADPQRDNAWRRRLQPYYEEYGLTADAAAAAPARQPFNETMCELVEQTRPAVVSFHFGLPAGELLARVKDAGCLVISSATTVAEAQWLEQHGCDAVIAQGYEGGGHRGMFLSEDLSTQIGTMALLPQVVDAVRCPVIAAGGIVDGRGIVAALALGASAVQLGTVYLLSPQAQISGLHRRELQQAGDNHTALTNVFSGRPARGLMNRIMREAGPISDTASHFPGAGVPLAPLKAEAEAAGRVDFSSLWSGQNNRGLRALDATQLTQQLALEALQCLQGLGVSR